MHVLLSVLSHLQVETIVQIFAFVRVEQYATFKVPKTELLLTIPHPRADLWQMSHLEEVEVKKMVDKMPGGGGGGG